eukprot:scaffold3079_cov119-Cylindrotheca_fusiformis.AAC.6
MLDVLMMVHRNQEFNINTNTKTKQPFLLQPLTNFEIRLVSTLSFLSSLLRLDIYSLLNMDVQRNESVFQKAPFQYFVRAVVCLIVVLASYMSSADNISTDASSSTLVNQIGSTQSRGKFVGDSFDGKDLYQAYKDIESTYYQVAFSETSQHLWKSLVNRDGIQVALMEHQSDPRCPYVRMEVEIEASVGDCWDFLSLQHWDETMPKMDPFYEGVEFHGEYSYKKVHMILARKRTARILTFGKRDFVFLSVTDEPLADGTWVSGTVSVQTPRVPRQKGYVRAFQDSIAFYKPISPNRTKITIVCRIDLNDSSDEVSAGGWIPMWLYVKTVGMTGAKSVMAMRSFLMKENSEQKDSQKASCTNQQTAKKKKRFSLPWSRMPPHHSGTVQSTHNNKRGNLLSFPWSRVPLQQQRKT